MDGRLALIPDDSDTSRGVVKPIAIKNGDVLYGASVGHWTSSTPDGNIHVVLYKDVDTIVHEVATSKAINAEIRATQRALNGVVIKPNIILDPKTKRFKEVWPTKEERDEAQ